MVHFAFSYGLDQPERTHLEASCKAVWGPTSTQTMEEFALYLPIAMGAKSVDNLQSLGAVAGYAVFSGSSNNKSRIHEEHLIDVVLDRKEWPLAQDWSGTFCAVAFSSSDRNLILFNDPIGYFPLYYSFSSGAVWGSTSLITLARFRGSEIDLTGLSQRMSSALCNYGRRTLIRNVQRLLPGELIRFEASSATGKSVFDNTLYDGTIDGDVRDIARTVWDAFKQEVARAVGENDRVSVGLSGGWDSRLLLGALKGELRTIQCYTYGDCRAYESEIAKRCAAIAGANHKCLSLVGHYIRHRNDLEPFVRTTEQAGYHFLLPFLDSSSSLQSRSILLLGDMTECIDGRNLGELASRAGRTRSFLRGLVGLRDELPVMTPEAVARWREKTTRKTLDVVLDGLPMISPALLSEDSRELVTGETSEDLDMMFKRVLGHNMTFLPTAHELFEWYQYVRYRPASQMLFLTAQWNCLSPPMSMRFLRLISRIHPRLRLRRRLMNAITLLPELKELSSIPSAQIPWVSSRAPNLLKELIWGFRSGVDQMLIKRAIQSRNSAERRRVLRSFDLVAEYRSPNAIDNVASWFSGRWVKRDELVQIARNRAALVSWPLVTIDIGSMANVSILLDLCYPDQPQQLVL